MPGVASVRLIVGMEVHVELSTRSKMFSRAPSPAHRDHDGAGPNTLIDPVVLGLPGALPVPNRRAVELSILVGLALGCRIAPFSTWDRKSYVYPDLPKGYQISQYDLPLCFDGAVDLPDPADPEGRGTRRIGIIRAHLEEDAGKLLHEWPGGGEIDFSIVDFNRAGTPLLEIVSAPDLASADEAVAFAQHLRDLCRFVGATEGVMQKGHIRFEPNINCELRLDDGRLVRTPVVEVKNLNSFKALRGAIEHELALQPQRFLSDAKTMGPGAKSTRGWDDQRQQTVLQREKEDALDYRYFRDPDLPPVVIDDAWRERLRAQLPELPHRRAERYADALGLGAKEARALAEDRATSDFFDAAVDAIASAAAPGARDPAGREQAGRLAANLVLQSGFRRSNERGVSVPSLGITPGQLAGLALLRQEEAISAAHADALFEALCASDEDAPAAAGRLGLLRVRDDAALDAWCAAAIQAQPQAAADVRAGKAAAIGRLVGEVMKHSGGKVDARAARERLAALLGAGA